MVPIKEGTMQRDFCTEKLLNYFLKENEWVQISTTLSLTLNLCTGVYDVGFKRSLLGQY